MAKAIDDRSGATLVDRYELLALAGKGGMGRVYRARDRAVDAIVAVKLLADEQADPARFAREASVLAAIRHPGVVRYLDSGESDGERFLVMEWLSGQDLAARLDDATLGVAETLGLARRVAEALAAAHRVGVVHRDVKPANLFLVGGDLGATKLLDFGLARKRDDSDITSEGGLVGTPAYMSPEQVRGESVDARADVYALGAVLFRCLTGRPPFGGSHRLAVLAKILLEDPAPIRAVCPDVPEEVEGLVSRLLAKDPRERPADADALADELRDIRAASSRHTGRARAAVTLSEQRVASVVLFARASAIEETVVEGSEDAIESAVRRAIERQGGEIDALRGGAWVITNPAAASPLEQAGRAVRCALTVGALRPRVPLVVATGKIVVAGQHHVGEVIDRAAEELVAARGARRTGVHVDAATAELLEGRFRFAARGAWFEVLGEEESFIPVRTLLGRPALCVGREAQVATIGAMLAECTAEARASAALVTGAPGLGKTHLLHEVLRGPSVPHDAAANLLFARGDPLRTGSAFGLAGDLIKWAAKVRDADDPALQRDKLAGLVARDFPDGDATRQRDLLGEISRIFTDPRNASPALRAARSDVSVMADAIRETWIEWITARAARGLVLLVVEDLQWVDATSLRLIEGALLACQDRPVFLLATSRPGGSSAVAERLRAAGLVEISLAPLSKVASERLARYALGRDADAAVVRELVRRAAGHPFHLEELVRAVAAGRGPDALPDTVLGMVQARLDAVDAQGRLLLRAASVFGDAFWPGAIAALMGDEVPPGEIERGLDDLVRRELLTEERSSKWRNERELRFRHALLREGAYAMLADRDRTRAHRRAAAWLESVGETDPVILAEHYDRGEAAEQATVFFTRAAVQALQRNDLERATSHAARARARGPSREVEATLGGVEAEIHYWRGEHAKAATGGALACMRLDRGSRDWFDAASATLGALGQLGRNSGVAEWLDEVANVTPSDNERGAQTVALCRGLTQLFWAHHPGDLARVRARLDAGSGSGAGGLAPFEAGWLHRVRGESAWLHEWNVDRCLAELDASCEEFVRARASRALCLTRMNAASLAGWSGAADRGLEWLETSRVEARRLGAGFLLDYGRAVEGLLLAFAEDPRAEAMMRAASAPLSGSPRLAFLCRVVSGWLALDRGDVGTATAESTAALAIDVAAELRAGGLALASRAAVASGDVERGIAIASEAYAVESGARDLELTLGLAGVALAQAALAGGDRARARTAALETEGRLSRVASTIASSDQRRSFLSRPLANAAVASMVRALGD